MAEVEPIETESWLYRWMRWSPTSMILLAQAERKLFKNIRTALQFKYVSIDTPDKRIWTAWSTAGDEQAIPLVLIHGMGGGIGLWAANIDALAENRPFYCFDLLGFGRSSRPKFSYDAIEAEDLFVDSIEKWREKMGLEKFVLLGHSLGGFVASSYALRYANRVQHLILADAWGFPERPPENERYPLPLWAKMAAAVFNPFNPLAILRAAGPWGPGLVSRFRPDFRDKFTEIVDDRQFIYDYIYHCNAQTPSGEAAFKTLSIPFGWAKWPMMRRIKEINVNVPITMIYGSRSWIDSNTGYQVKYLRHPSCVDVQMIRGAGHHVYADRPHDFNLLVNEICLSVDKHSPDLDTPPPRRQSTNNNKDIAGDRVGQYCEDVRQRLSNGDVSECVEGLPVRQMDLTESEEGLPVRQMDSSESEEGLPVRQMDLSVSEEWLPVMDLSESEEELPDKQDDLSESEDGLPVGQIDLSESAEGLPVTQRETENGPL